MKNTPDYKSRFRILKGGKISLVVSALVVGASLIGPDAHAIGCSPATNTISTNTTLQSIIMCEDTSITVSDDLDVNLDFYALNVSNFGGGDYFATISNAGNISLDNTGWFGETTAVSIETDYFSLANNAGSDINATGEDNTYGIKTQTLVDSTIINNGTINVAVTDYPGWGDAYGIDTYDLEGNSSIINNATINVTSLQAYSYGGINTSDLHGTASILNSGTINSDGIEGAYGIQADNLYDNTSITNEGSISVVSLDGYGYGIEANWMSGNSSIENTASGVIDVNVSTSARGIQTNSLDQNASILNNGTITVISNNSYAYGIETYDLEDNASIINDGNIIATAAQDAYGILIEDLDTNATIVNSASGVIEVSGDYFALGIGTQSLYADSNILNEGAILVSSDYFASGIFTENLYSNASILNQGDIIISSGDEAVGIHSYFMGEDSNITNAAGALIDVNASSKAIGIGASEVFGISMQNNATITNAGTINVNSSDYAVGIAAKYESSNGASNASIINSGTITATIDGEADANAFSIKSGYFGYGIDVENTEDGKLYGNIYVDGGNNDFDATLTNSGLISLPHNANNANGDYSAYATNFVQTATGTLEIGLFSDDTLGEDYFAVMSHSQLSTNNAYFADGSNIAVNVLTLGATNQGLLVGQTMYNVVTADNNLTVDGTLDIDDNSALLNFEYFLTNGEDANITETDGTMGAIHLNIVEGSSILDSSVAGLGNTNTQEAARVLDVISDGDYPQMDTFINALGTQCETDEEVAAAVASTTPVTATASVGASSQISNGVQGIVEMRQRANVSGGENSGDAVFAEKNLWIKPFGSVGSQSNKDGMNGFDVKAAGVGFGFDGEYMSNQKIGLALFYAKANVDVSNMDQTSDLGVLSTLVYGNIPVLDDKTNFLYQLGYAWQNTDSERYIALTNQTAKADYTSNTASLDLKVIRDYQVSSRFLLQPLVETTYRNFSSPDYTETGADALNLISDKFSTDELLLGGGVLAHYKLDNVSKIIGNVNAGYDLYDKQQTVTTAYSGASGVKFETNGIDNGRWNYDLGIGYERDIKEGNNINFMYNYQGQGATFENHTLSAKYVLTF